MSKYEKAVGIKFKNGTWLIINLKIENVIPLNLDNVFSNIKTSIRFKGTSLNGRLLYAETDLPRIE